MPFTTREIENPDPVTRVVAADAAMRNQQAEQSGGSTGYQTLINDALRQHVEGTAPRLEDMLRRILREEMRAHR